MSLLQSKRFNDWPLFYLIFAINSLAMIGYMQTQDLSTIRGLREMIQCSVRVSVPLLFLAFAASSIAPHVPSALRKWLIRNRRYFGLGFAAGFAWQLFFILLLLFGHTDHFKARVFTGFEDLVIYQLGPYSFLVAMTITSFFPVRKRMNRKVWYAIHWIGIYYLWWNVTLTYYEYLFLYGSNKIIDYIYFTLAYLARVGEWTRIQIAKLPKAIPQTN